jgi:hypothetical protein
MKASKQQLSSATEIVKITITTQNGEVLNLSTLPLTNEEDPNSKPLKATACVVDDNGTKSMYLSLPGFCSFFHQAQDGFVAITKAQVSEAAGVLFDKAYSDSKTETSVANLKKQIEDRDKELEEYRVWKAQQAAKEMLEVNV